MSQFSHELKQKPSNKRHQPTQTISDSLLHIIQMGPKMTLAVSIRHHNVILDPAVLQ